MHVACIRTHLISSASAVSLVPRPEDRTRLLSSSLGSFSGPPSSPSLLPECWAGAGNEATLVSRGYLSSCSSSTPCFLLCPGLTQPVLYLLCCFNSVPGAVSRSILRFSLRLVRCLRGSLREHDCAISTIDPRSFTLRTSISTTPGLRFTSGTWL